MSLTNASTATTDALRLEDQPPLWATRNALRAPHPSGSLLLVLLLGFSAAVSFAFNWTSNSYRPILRSDPEGYYAYLPAWFVDGDPSLASVAQHRYGGDAQLMGQYGLRRSPGGGVVDKYGVGVAVAELPLFLTGHLVTRMSGDGDDGYSEQEQLLSAFAGVVAGIIGLLALRSVLLRRYSPGATTAAIACTCLGTSLLDYIGYDSGFSHAFSFAALTLVLLTAVRWAERPGSWSRAAALGTSAGYLALVRPTNIALVCSAALIGTGSRTQLMARLRALWRWRGYALTAAGCALAAFAPQLIAWHAESGAWITSPYPASETLDPLHPHLGALVSFAPHGLLPYAPVLLLVPLGVFVMWRRRDPWLWMVMAGILIQTAVVAAWHDWWYGAGFGQRGFVDASALFAVALGAAFQEATTGTRRLAVGVPAAALTALTCLLTVAYWQGRMPLEGVPAGDYLHTLVG